MNEDKLYVELMLSSANPHISFLSLTHTILESQNIDSDTRQYALQKVVDAYEEICRDQSLQYA